MTCCEPHLKAGGEVATCVMPKGPDIGCEGRSTLKACAGCPADGGMEGGGEGLEDTLGESTRASRDKGKV